MDFLTSDLFVYVAAGVSALAAVGVTLGVIRGDKQDTDADGDVMTSAPGSVREAPTSADAGSDQRTEPGAVTPTTVAVDEEPAAPTLERPDDAKGRLVRLRARLARSNSAIGKALLGLLSSDTIDEETWEDIEDTLLSADLGMDPAMELVDRLRERVKVLGTQDQAQVRDMLLEELTAMVDPTMDRDVISTRQGDRPAVVLVVGVNGAGKTTSVGKIARVFVAEDKNVVLGAADTFRAAAADQLQTWGQRIGVPTVRSAKEQGGDAAAVAFDAVQVGVDTEADVVLLDTAGRLQNKAGLMDELGKVKRVAEKPLNGESIDEVLLVIDATTGQNGLQQAKVFSEAVNITGVVLTKLDGTAKGGIVVAIQRLLGVPVKLVGLGEGADDLAPFDAADFARALVN